MKIKFKHYNCDMSFGRYSNGRIAIELVENGEPVAVATVNLPNENLEADEIAIKDYSENEGMLRALLYGGVVTTPIRFVNIGFVKIPICKLLIFK